MTREKDKLTGTSNQEGENALVVPSSDTELRMPSLYKVLLHNDDYTPMEFVIEILETVFHKANILATKIMLDVHKKGSGLCGVYPFEVAETKVALVIDKARQHRHPLKCTMEEE